MNFKINIIDKIAIYKVEGSLDTHNASKMQKYINETKKDTEKIIVNLTECNYLSSTAIGVLINLNITKEKKDNDFVIIVVPISNDSIRNVINLTSLNKLFKIFESFEDCAEYLAKKYQGIDKDVLLWKEKTKGEKLFDEFKNLK